MKKTMAKFAERFHPGDAIGFAYGTPSRHGQSPCPRRALPTHCERNYVGCSTGATPVIGTQEPMDIISSCFEQENKRWARILASPQKLEEHLSKRLDSDRMHFLRD